MHLQGLTLLVEDNNELAKFYQLNLKIWIGANVTRAANLKDVETFLQKNKNVSLIISKSSFSPMVKKFIEADNIRSISHINIGSKSDEGVSVKNSLNIKPLMQASAKALGVTAENMANLEVPEYFPIELEYFRFIKVPVCDIYIGQENGYLIEFPIGSEMAAVKIDELAKTGHKTLYVKKSDRLKVVTNITQEIVSQIAPEALNDDEKMSATEAGQKLLQYKLKTIGITPETVELAKSNMKNMVDSSRRFPKLSRLVQRLLKNKTGYLYQHSQILMFVCSHLMDHIEWGNEDQKKTINFVAFFHDIALGTDEQAKIHSSKQLKESQLGEKEKALVNMHAQIAAEFVQKFPHAPMGADSIVRQHHGIAHGVGFSEHYSANLSPMSVVFILAEDFVDHIIESGENFKLEEKIKDMRQRYSTQRFQKIIDILEDITL